MANTLNPRFNRRGIILIGIILSVLILDQVLKIWVKTSFHIGESRDITSWFSLTFVENNGMAFGWSLGNKLFLSLFRILFVIVLGWGIIKAIKSGKCKTGFLVCLALIIAGAVGNIIDCIFYGEIFNNPTPPQVADFVPIGEGYSGWFQGRVVDMLSFHFFSFEWPSWIPIIGGETFDFFGPIFNLADASISVGVIALILFYSRGITPFIEIYKGVLKKTSSENSL